MPIYEYRCQECGHELEKLQRMSDDPLTDCPSCGQSQLKRLVSAAAFRLKGGGWYETDFKQDNKRNLAGDSDTSQSGEGKKEGSSGDGGKSGASSSGDGGKSGDSSSGGTAGKTETKKSKSTSGTGKAASA
jgi:putative FmdB family regulatory protein